MGLGFRTYFSFLAHSVCRKQENMFNRSALASTEVLVLVLSRE